MSYMEQQMQNLIESGISEADKCYSRISELEKQCLALEAQNELLFKSNGELDSLCTELIDHLRYSKAERTEVLEDFWQKQSNIESVPRKPKQAIKKIQVEVIKEFCEWASTLPNLDCMLDDKDEYIHNILEGN